MSRDGSVAPKERINVKFVPSTGDQQAEIELPMKTIVVGDFTGRADDSPIEGRQAVEIDKHTFNSVMKEMDLERTLEVKDVLSEEDDDATLTMSLSFETLKDFEPDSIAQKVPELKKLLELRDALSGLKGPLGNMPAFRKALNELMEDPDARGKILAQIEKSQVKDSE